MNQPSKEDLDKKLDDFAKKVIKDYETLYRESFPARDIKSVVVPPAEEKSEKPR